MIIIYLVFLCVFLIGIKFTKKDFNEEYLSKNTTTIINGLFVVTVFFSHFKNYIETTSILDTSLNKILGIVGQLMVATFLFYSGYGIMESIKNKKGYVKNFFKNRFVPTFLNFAIAICLFLIMDIAIGKNYSVSTIALSFIGWDNVGNSDWYMFATFVLYLFTIISFLNFDNTSQKKSLHNHIAILALLTILYVIVIGQVKEARFVNTVLCYIAGVFYSCYRERIENVVQKSNWTYCITSIVVCICFIGIFLANKLFGNVLKINLIYNLYAILFVFIVLLVSMKFKLNNKVFTFLGQHIFWIYILQRIPMILLQGKLSNYFYFAISLAATILMSIAMKNLMDKIWKR